MERYGHTRNEAKRILISALYLRSPRFPHGDRMTLRPGKLICLVRPERFELPTLWFEAKCSIQLSYGRVKQKSQLQEHPKNNELPDFRQLASHSRLRRLRRSEHRHRLDDIESCAPQQLIDHWLG